jgi:phosphoribosyl 1,2-cyclic phosphate phosphodiesterase
VTAALEVTILGCGSSGGVPRADGAWGDCDPADPRNRRSRCSLLVRRKGLGPADGWTSAIVDTSPDFRLQCAEAGVKRLDAVLLSHDHADQTHGIDDVRAFYLRQGDAIDCYMDAPTRRSMLQRFGYAFEGRDGYPQILQDRALPPHGGAWRVEGPSGPIPVVSFDQDHGPVRSAGFRFGDVAYSSDVVELDDAAFDALQGLEVWIVDALRWRPHPTHAHVERALEWIARARPKRAILTNLHIDLDYRALAERLPPNVEPAYDGLRFDHLIDGELTR